MNQPQRKVTLTSLTPKPTTYKAKAFCNNCDSVVEGDFEFAVPLYSSPCPKCGCKHLTTMVAYRNSQRDGASLTSVSRNAIFNSPSLQRVDVDFSGVEMRMAAYLRENPGALRQDPDLFRREFLSQYQQEPVGRTQYQQEPVSRSLLSEAGLRALRNVESPLVSEAARQRAAEAQQRETRRLQREADRYAALTDDTLGIAWDPAWSREQQPSSTPTPAEIQAAIDSVSPYIASRQPDSTSSMPPYEVAMADAASDEVTQPVSEPVSIQARVNNNGDDFIEETIHYTGIERLDHNHNSNLQLAPADTDAVLGALNAASAISNSTLRSIVSVPLRQPDDQNQGNVVQLRGESRPSSNGCRGITLPRRQSDAVIDCDIVDPVAYDAAVAASGILRPTYETNRAFDTLLADLSIIGTPSASPNPLLAAFHASEQFERRVDAAARRRDEANDALFEEMVQAIEESTDIGHRIINADGATGISNLSDDDSPVVVGDSSSPGETDDEEEGEQEGGHANEQAPTEQ